MASRKIDAINSREQLLFKEPNKGEFKGYKQEILIKSLTEVESEFYVCTKCNGIMRNACQIGNEQNSVCEICARGSSVHPMLKSRKKIQGLGVKCPLKGRGCEWNGTIGEIDAHLDVCTEFIVNCTNKCDVIMKRSELINHCKNECQNRIVNCEHCKLKMQYNELGNHIKTCAEFPLLCPNACMKNLTRKEVESHVEKECPNTLLNCKNKCGIQLKRSKMQNHCENECQNREMNCTYCKAIVLFKEIEIHNKTCPEFPLLCPNECLKKIPRKMLNSHCKNDCQNTIMECSYNNMGCKSKIRRIEVDKHEEIFESKHLRMTVMHFSNKFEEVIKKLYETESENMLLKGENKLQKTEYTKKLNQYESELDLNRKQHKLLETNMMEMDKKMKELSENSSYQTVLRDEIGKGLIEYLLNTEISNYLRVLAERQLSDFRWNQHKLCLIFKYDIIRKQINAVIRNDTDYKNVKMAKKYKFKAIFKLTIFDPKYFHKSLVYLSRTQELKLYSPFDSCLNRLVLAEIPADLILQQRLRNEKNTITFMLQMQEVDDFLM